MRFDMPARRIASAAAVGLALAMTAAACSSSSSSASAPASSSSAPASSSAASSPASSPASPGGTSNAAAVAAVTTNWEAFFDPKTSATKKIALLQNGQKFASVIQAQSGSSMASGASAKVTKVVVTSPTQATVTYNILLNGTPALSNQTGTAVNEGGTWKVGDTSFCALLTLENNGKAPSVCSSAG